MGWTNNPKTNVQRVESWSSKQTLYNKLNRIYRQLCCLINDEAKLLKNTVVISNAELVTFGTPVEIVPAGTAAEIIVPSTVVIEAFLNGGGTVNFGVTINSIIAFNPGATDSLVAFSAVGRMGVDKIFTNSIYPATISNADTQLLAGTSLVMASTTSSLLPINIGDPTGVDPVKDLTLRVTTYYHVYDTT